MLMDPYPIQQHTGLHCAVYILQQEVTRPKARFKPALLKKGEQSGANIFWSVTSSILPMVPLFISSTPFYGQTRIQFSLNNPLSVFGSFEFRHF